MSLIHRENIRFIHPSFAVAWPGCFSQASCEQDLCSNGFKAVSTSHSLGQFHETIQTLGISSSVAISEVVENGVSIVLNRQREWQEGFVDIRGDLPEPSKVGLQGNLFCWSFIDGIKGFFEVISNFQAREVQEPRFQDQGFPLGEVMRASQQKEPIVHQGSALFVGQALSYLLADSFQASRKQFQNMELVYNQAGMWQCFMGCIVVGSPHVSTNNGDALLCGSGQIGQITDNTNFSPVSKQINDVMIVDISDNTTILMQQVQFINTQIEQLVVWKARLNGSGVLAEENTNGALDDAHFVSNAYKGSSECLLLDVDYHTMRHEVVFIHTGKRLEEGSMAGTTEKTMTLYGDPDPLSSNGQVHEQLRFSLVAMQLVMAAMDTVKWRYYQHHLEVKIMCMFIHYKNAKVGQAQEIQAHLSHCRVLPKKFSLVRVKTVARERRLQRVIYCNPTHFRDVEIVCWSVKNGAIPRGIAISRF